MFDWFIIAFLICILFTGIITIFAQSLEILCSTDKTSKKEKRKIVLNIIIAAIAVVVSFEILMMLR